MIRRLLSACLGAAAFVGMLEMPTRSVAKPPDLPMNETITATPQADPEVEKSSDISVDVSEANTGSLIFGVGVNSNSGLTGSVVLNERNYEALPMPQQDAAAKKKHKKHHRKFESLPMPKEDASTRSSADGLTCPYLRQQQYVDRHARQSVDPEIGRDVLDNLERLKKAETLLELATDLARMGYIGEALACCVHAQDLCPGSPCASRAAEVMLDVCFGSDKPATATEEAAEEYPQSNRSREVLEESEDLKTIEAEWKRIADSDLPSYMTPERVNGGVCGEDAPGQKCSSKKSVLEQKLQQAVNVSFTKVPLRQAIDELRDIGGINIYVDAPALAEKGIDLDSPIEIKLDDISFKSALNLILASVQLTYIIKDEVIQVTTEEHARGKLERYVYPVGDLIEHKKLPKGWVCKPCETKECDENFLLKLLTNTIAPRSWSEQGGAGTIDYFPRTQTLIVNQTADVQDEIVDLLAALRRLYEREGETKEESDHAPKTDASKTEPGVEEQVGGLMKSCHLLMNEGMYEQAAELARQAFALDPERVMADPLLYKMHLLAETPAQQPAGASEASEPPSCPYCPVVGKPISGIVPEMKPSACGPTTLLVPPLPPVDYEVVPALDCVLTETATGAEEASENHDAPSSLADLVEAIVGDSDRVEYGVGADGQVRMTGEFACGGTVYHVLYKGGCLAIWKTPDAAQTKP